MGTLTAIRFLIVWRWFQLLGVFQSFGIGFCFWGYQRNFITSCIDSLLQGYSGFKRAKEECMKESVGKYRSTIGRFVFGRTKFTRSPWIVHFAEDILLLHH